MCTLGRFDLITSMEFLKLPMSLAGMGTYLVAVASSDTK
jgi:hypothetical protein